MVNIFDIQNFQPNNFKEQSNMMNVLMSAVQLAANYDKWENDKNLQDIVDMKKNYFCKMLKSSHSYLDEKSIKCISMAILVHMFKEISTFTSLDENNNDNSNKNNNKYNNKYNNDNSNENENENENENVDNKNENLDNGNRNNSDNNNSFV